MITYDSKSSLSLRAQSVLKFRGMDAAPVPRDVLLERWLLEVKRGVSPVSALPRAMAAFSQPMTFHPTDSRFTTLLEKLK